MNKKTCHVEIAIVGGLQHVSLGVDCVWNKQPDNCVTLGVIKSRPGKVVNMEKNPLKGAKHTIIFPFGDRRHGHSTFENSTPRSEDH